MGGMEQCREQGYRTWGSPIEVGARGFPSKSCWKMLGALGVQGRARLSATWYKQQRLREDVLLAVTRADSALGVQGRARLSATWYKQQRLREDVLLAVTRADSALGVQGRARLSATWYKQQRLREDVLLAVTRADSSVLK